MLAFAAPSANKHRTHGESGVSTHIDMTVDRSNNNPTVDPQWTRSGQRVGHERAMGERAMNEQQTCGESIASIQPTMCWQHSRFEICGSSPDDRIQRAISFSLGEHDLRQWTDSYWDPLLRHSADYNTTVFIFESQTADADPSSMKEDVFWNFLITVNRVSYG